MKLKTRIAGAAVRHSLKPQIEALESQKPSKKRDLLLHLLSGHPSSQRFASVAFNIGDYRDQIYQLRKAGYDIRSYDGLVKSCRYGTTRVRFHYYGAYALDYVKMKEKWL